MSRNEAKKNREGNDLIKNKWHWGGGVLLINEAKKIGMGMVEQAKNGFKVGWKSLGNETSKKMERNYETKNEHLALSWDGRILELKQEKKKERK